MTLIVIPLATILMILVIILAILGFIFWAILLGVFLGIGAVIFWIYMLINSIQRKYKHSNDKIVWILVIILLGFLGSIIYYFAVKRKDKTKKK